MRKESELSTNLSGLDLLDSEERKNTPIATGVLDYFPDAIAAVAQLSVYGNEKHNPGEPLGWSKGKSNDHADCVARHLIQRGTVDYSFGWDKPVRHSTALAWRALALLQTEIEDDRKSQIENPNTELRLAAARDELYNTAETEYLSGHGITGIAKAGYTDLEAGGTHKSGWPYEADEMVAKSEALPAPNRSQTTIATINQKAWKPGVGG